MRETLLSALLGLVAYIILRALFDAPLWGAFSACMLVSLVALFGTGIEQRLIRMEERK